MRIFTKRTIQEGWQKYPDAEGQLQAWYYEAKNADWKTPADIKQKYGNASLLADNRVVFNICGNKYRLIVKIAYRAGLVYVRFFGTHKEYDKINAEEI